MRYINWNIKCYCNIDRIVMFLKQYVEYKQCIIALQEVMPDKAEYISNHLSDDFHISYSLYYREAGEFDTDNRRLGVMLLISKDMDIVETNVFNRCLFPERTLYATVKHASAIYKIVTLHSLTGVSFKMGKAVQFRSFAECINEYKPDIISFDANEPKVDHYEIDKMIFFDQDDGGKGARLFFEEIQHQNMIDAFGYSYNQTEFVEGEPLAISHMLPNGVGRRYDFVFVKENMHVHEANYFYREALGASSDHAAVVVDMSL